MRLKHLLKVYSSLGWFKGLATLQAACFVARRDESTKRAHPLRREIAVVCFHSKDLPQRSSHKSTHAANTDNKRVKDGIHNSTPRFFLALQVHNDTATLVILCKSARLGIDMSSGRPWTQRQCEEHNTKVSNLDQLLLMVAIMIVVRNGNPISAARDPG